MLSSGDIASLKNKGERSKRKKMPPKGIRRLTEMDPVVPKDGSAGAPAATLKPDPKPAAPSDQADSPKAPSPKYVEDIVCNLTPHVRLIRRTNLLPPRPPMLLVRKTVVDPDRAGRELQHLYAQCRHPNVLKYVSGVKHRDHSVDIDMEFCDGGTLSKVLENVAKNDRITAAKCCVRQVLCGLSYYHECHGRCHRDVKASNFLVRCDGIVKVSDFDVSKEMNTAGDANGGGANSDITVRGTGPYMSPELVLNGFNLDPVKCDIWSVGVTIFQLLEGCLPFERFRFGSFTAPSDIHVKQLHWELVDKDPALEYLMRRCLRIRPEDRPNLNEATAITIIVSSATPPKAAGAADAVAVAPAAANQKKEEEIAAAAAAAAAASSNSSSAPAAVPAAVTSVAAAGVQAEALSLSSGGTVEKQDSTDSSKAMMAAAAANSVVISNGSMCTPQTSSSGSGSGSGLLDSSDSDPWSNGFASPDHPDVVAAKNLNIKLSDEVLLQCRCYANDPDIDAKVKRAGLAIHEELQSWKAVRGNATTRDAVDKVMKEIVRLRCEKTWKILAQVAKLQQPAAGAASSGGE